MKIKGDRHTSVSQDPKVKMSEAFNKYGEVLDTLPLMPKACPV